MTNVKSHDTGQSRAYDTDGHLKECATCAEQAKAIDAMIESLEDHTDVFCPEAWQLYELVVHGEDPTGEIAGHVAQCAGCSEKAASLRDALTNSPEPPESLMAAVRAARPASIERQPLDLMSRIRQAVSDFFSVPILAFGAATAAVVLAVIMIPLSEPEQMIALSSVDWKSGISLLAPSHTGSPDKPKAAVMVVLSSFKEEPPQDFTDSLYRAIRPTAAMKKRYEFMSPGEVKAVLSHNTDLKSPTETLKALSTRQGVSTGIVITVEPTNGSYDIQAAITEASTGSVEAELSVPHVDKHKLAAKVKESVRSLTENRKITE